MVEKKQVTYISLIKETIFSYSIHFITKNVFHRDGEILLKLQPESTENFLRIFRGIRARTEVGYGSHRLK